MTIHYDKRAYEAHCALDRGAHRAERIVIGLMLLKPDLVEDVKPKLSEHAFAEDLNRNIVAGIYGLHDEGLTPCKTELVKAWGDYPVDEKMQLSDYLSGCVDEAIPEAPLPIDGIVRSIADTAKRRLLEEAAHTLQIATDGQRSVVDVGRSAIDQIQSILTNVGAGERKSATAKDLSKAGLAYLEGKSKAGPKTGFSDLDRHIDAWPLAQLTVVAARPGMGKSAFMTSAALNAAKGGANVLIFSLEMTQEQLGARMLSDLCYSSQDPVQYQSRGRISTRHRDLLAGAQIKLDSYQIEVCDRSAMSIEDIHVHARMTAAELEQQGKALDLIFVDHIGLVRPSDRYAGNRVREIAECTQGLCDLAKRLNVPVVALCQLNRAVEGRENKRATLSDLRDSGAIEEDASLVLMLYRPAYYAEKNRFDDAEAERKRLERLQTTKNSLEIGIDKNRNGPPGRVDLFIDVGSNAVRTKSFRG